MTEHQLLERLRARNADRLKRTLSHLQWKGEALLRQYEAQDREKHKDGADVTGEDEAAPVRRSRTRKPSLVSVARQAAKAGLEVARYEVDSDGKISIITGKPDITNADQPNEWDRLQ